MDLSLDESVVQQVASMHVQGFRAHWLAAYLDKVLLEVRESLSEERIGRVALEEDTVLGWIGGSPDANGADKPDILTAKRVQPLQDPRE